MIGAEVTTRQAATILGVHPTTVRRRCRRGTLQGVKTPRGWAITFDATLIVGEAIVTYQAARSPHDAEASARALAILEALGQDAVIDVLRRERALFAARAQDRRAKTQRANLAGWLDHKAHAYQLATNARYAELYGRTA